MHIITRRLEFDAGHRLVGHESKCANLHGHRYVADISVTADEGLDGVGRVIDFSRVKDIVGGWIDRNWDHNLILNSEDPLLSMWEDSNVGVTWETIFGNKDPFVMHINPTAENMSEYLYGVAKQLLEEKYYIKVVSVRLYETPNCWADFPYEKPCQPKQNLTDQLRG